MDDPIEDTRFYSDDLKKEFGDSNVFLLGEAEDAEKLRLPSLEDVPNLQHIRLGDYQSNGYRYTWKVDTPLGRLYVKQKVAE